MAEADARSMLTIARRDLKAAWILRAGADVEAHRELARFTNFALQIRYDVEPEPMGLDRAAWLQRAEQLVEHVASLIGAGS